MITPQTDLVQDFLVQMKSQTDSIKLSEHFYAIPRRIDGIINGQVWEFYTNDRKRNILNPANEICISIDAIKFCSMVSRSYRAIQDSWTSIIDLIEFHRIYPFLLFINGRFIPWHNIDLIVSFEKYYLLIHDLNEELNLLVRDADNVNMIGLPSNIIYSEGVHSNDLTTIFAFNELGEYDLDNWSYSIYMEPNEILVRDFNNIGTGAKYKFFQQNFFYFTDGLYDTKPSVTCLGDCAVFNNVADNTKILFISNTLDKLSESIDNLAKAKYSNIQSDIKEYIQNPTEDSYLSALSPSFEFMMDRNLSYSENRQNAIEYILKYRTDLFFSLYEIELEYFSITVDYSWLQNHRDQDGYLSLPRRSSLGKDYYIIVMVNGELYKYYRHHYYRANKFICPITSISQNDKIELLFFKNANEYEIKCTIKAEDPFTPLSPIYYNNDAKIFSRHVPSDAPYQYPADGDQAFPVDFSIVKNNDNQYKIIFDNEEYYGKECIVTPDNTFRYFGFNLSDEDQASYKVSLGTNFMYCNEYDRYLVFKNGRRLSNDFYRLTLPTRLTTPFYKYEIYLAVPLATGDRLDVFYLPNKIKDINLAIDMPTDGRITINKSDLPYLFSKNTYTFWVNGKKINNSDIEITDSNTLQITTDQKTTRAIRITAMREPIEEIESIHETIDNSAWDKSIVKSSVEKLLGIRTISATNTEPDIYADNVPIEAIMMELVREHYLSNSNVDITGPFVYGYEDIDTSIIEDVDKGGNNIIDVANAERRDNLDIDRYYPEAGE